MTPDRNAMRNTQRIHVTILSCHKDVTNLSQSGVNFRHTAHVYDLMMLNLLIMRLLRIFSTPIKSRNTLPVNVVEDYHFKVSNSRLKCLGMFLQLAYLSHTKQAKSTY